MKDMDIDLNLAEFQLLIPFISNVVTNTKIGPSRFYLVTIAVIERANS